MNRRALLLAAGLVALVLLTVGVMRYRANGASAETRAGVSSRGGAASATASQQPHEPQWPNGQRITVEVLNATRVRGLARRATLTLRDNGFDVVSTGTNPDQFDSTQILDRTGHRDWAVRAAKAMGGGAVLVRPDSSREVDLTVLIGASWHPPSQPFYP